MTRLLPLVALSLIACRGGVATLEKLDDTGDERPDGIDFVDGTGMAGAMGALEWYELQGDYWTDESQSFGAAWWGLIDPRDVYYWDLFGDQPDDCVNGPVFPSVRVLDLEVDTATLSAGDVRIQLRRADDGLYDASVSREQFLTASAYDVQVDEAARAPAFEVASALRTPEAPVVTAPNIGGSAAPYRAQDNLRVAWEPGQSDAMLLLVERVDDEGQVEETVACRMQDDGEFQVPADAWQGDWTPGQWLHLYVGAANQGQGVVPMNNGDSRAVGVSWALGAVIAR